MAKKSVFEKHFHTTTSIKKEEILNLVTAKKRGAYFLDEWLPVQEWLEHFVNSLISYDHDAHSFVFYTQLTKSRSNPLSSNQSELSHRHSYSLAQENPVRLPSLHTPGDWSGVPPFKVS